MRYGSLVFTGPWDCCRAQRTPSHLVRESFHLKLRNKMYLCNKRSIMLLLWHRTPILLRYPKNDSSEKQELALAGLSLVLAISIWIWSIEWCFGRSRYRYNFRSIQRCAKCCHEIRWTCKFQLHSWRSDGDRAKQFIRKEGKLNRIPWLEMSIVIRRPVAVLF